MKTKLSKLTESILNFKYGIAARAAELRGMRTRWEKGMRHSDALLIGPDVEIQIIGPKSCLELKDSGSTPKEEDIYVRAFPRACSIGFYPHWKFQNPGSRTFTKISLHSGSRLVMFENTMIAPGTYLSAGNGNLIEIGPHSYLGHDSQINSRSQVKIGSGCLIGQQVMIIDYDGHPIFHESKNSENLSIKSFGESFAETFGGDSAPIEISDNVWVGVRSLILKGVTLGKGSIVGAGSVVTQSVPPNTMVGGNPAKIIREGVSWKRY